MEGGSKQSRFPGQRYKRVGNSTCLSPEIIFVLSTVIAINLVYYSPPHTAREPNRSSSASSRELFLIHQIVDRTDLGYYRKFIIRHVHQGTLDFVVGAARAFVGWCQCFTKGMFVTSFLRLQVLNELLHRSYTQMSHLHQLHHYHQILSACKQAVKCRAQWLFRPLRHNQHYLASPMPLWPNLRMVAKHRRI